MITNRIKGYIVTEEGRVIGEVKNFDPMASDGQIMLYKQGYGYFNGVLKQNCKVVSERDIKHDELLSKSLQESKYQIWRFDNRKTLTGEYERTRKNSYDFDQFCRKYFTAERDRVLTEYLSNTFAECFDYMQFAYYFDLERDPEGGD